MKLLALKPADKENLRLLEMLALKDPGAVARLISLANSAFYARARPAATVSDALQTLGSASAYDALLLTWLQNAVVRSPADTRAMAYLVRHTFAMSFTLHRVESHIPSSQLPPGLDLGLLAIFDKLGLSFLLSDELSPSASAREALLLDARTNAQQLHSDLSLQPGFECSALIAEAWGLDKPLRQALQTMNSSCAVGNAGQFSACELILFAESVLQQRTSPSALSREDVAAGCGQRLYAHFEERGVQPVSLAWQP